MGGNSEATGCGRAALGMVQQEALNLKIQMWNHVSEAGDKIDVP